MFYNLFKFHIALSRLIVNDVGGLTTGFATSILGVIDAHSVHNLKIE